MSAVSAAVRLRRTFQKRNRHPCFCRGDRCAERRISSADDQDIRACVPGFQTHPCTTLLNRAVTSFGRQEASAISRIANSSFEQVSIRHWPPHGGTPERISATFAATSPCGIRSSGVPRTAFAWCLNGLPSAVITVTIKRRSQQAGMRTPSDRSTICCACEKLGSLHAFDVMRQFEIDLAMPSLANLKCPDPDLVTSPTED